MEIDRCSRCGKKFENFRINVVLNISTQRLKDNEIWEGIENLKNTSKEILCEDCFNKFSEILEQMNLDEE